MAGNAILVIDLGTSGVKAAVCDGINPPTHVARAPVSRLPNGGTGASDNDIASEYDQSAVRNAIQTAAIDALADADLGGGRVAAIAVSGLRLAVAFLDEDRATVYFGPNDDMRSVFQGAAIDERLAYLVHGTTGRLPSFLQAWSKLAWFRDECPDRFEQIKTTITASDWVILQLTGELAVDSAAGVESGLVGLQDGEVNATLRDALGFAHVKIPPAPNGPLTLTKRWAAELGLDPDTPVVNAGPDTQLGLLGMGLDSLGDTGVIAGWSCAVQTITDAPFIDAERGLWTGRYVVPGQWVLEGNLGIMGGTYKWLVELLMPLDQRRPQFEVIDREAATAMPGNEGITAHLGPSLLNMSALGLTAGGVIFPVPLAISSPTRGDIARAAIENFAYAIKQNIRRIEEITGTPTAAVGLGGGMTRSRIFSETVANVLGTPIVAGGESATLMGAARMTVEGLGLALPVDLGRDTIEPDRTITVEFEDLYEQWLERAAALGKWTL